MESKKLRIGLFTDTYYPEINGVANAVYQLKKGLEEIGHTVYVFTVKNPEATEAENNVYRLRSIPLPLLKDRRLCVSFLRKWKWMIRVLNLDVIHTHTEFILGHLGRVSAEKLGIVHIHTYHTQYEDYTHYLKIPEEHSRLAKAVVRKFSRRCCNLAQGIIVPTVKTENLLKGYGVKSPIVIQPSGMDVAKFWKTNPDRIQQLRRQYNLTNGSPVFLYVGRLAKEKNIGELLTLLEPVLKNHTQAKLMIVGEGPEKDRLQKMCTELGIAQSVIMTGGVPFSEIENYYALGDIFVCASNSETQGLTYIEAMASGLCLLVKQDECLNDVLKPGVNGFAYTDEKDFSANIYELMHMDEMSLRRMKENAIKTAERYETGYYAKKIHEVYQRFLLEKKTAKRQFLK
jgi:1,2-diacylglycerol 3-alpha-glucosyltransferase